MRIVNVARGTNDSALGRLRRQWRFSLARLGITPACLRLGKTISVCWSMRHVTLMPVLEDDCNESGFFLRRGSLMQNYMRLLINGMHDTVSRLVLWTTDDRRLDDSGGIFLRRGLA